MRLLIARQQKKLYPGTPSQVLQSGFKDEAHISLTNDYEVVVQVVECSAAFELEEIK